LRNNELVQLGLAAARASSERDAVEIATLEAQLRTAEDRHRVTVDTTRVDRERLAEAEYLCYLGGRVYEEQDRATRTRTAWERSDQRRLEELEEISTLLPPKKRPQLRAETFELPPTLLPQLGPYPRGSQDTTEMDRALEDVRDYYGGPVIRLPGYPGVNSLPFYSVPPGSSPEAPQCTP
jgi:hypothetical protein